MLLSLLLWACDSDVSIIKRVEETGQSIGVGEPGEPVAIAPQPTTEPGYEQQRAGVTGLSTMYLRQIACPACMGETQELTVQYEANFHQPITDSWNSWLPPDGTCDQYLYRSTPSTQPIHVGQVIQVSSQNHQFDAYQSGAGTYQSQNIWESHLQRNTQYNVQTSEGSFTFTTIEGFDYIEPYTMLWVDPSYAFETPIYRSGASFSWAPTSINHTFNVTVAVYSPDGSQLLGYVTCGGPDNGFMQIPAQYLQSYPYGGLVAVHLVRHKVELVETDINNSYIETHTEWQVIGTGRIE